MQDVCSVGLSALTARRPNEGDAPTGRLYGDGRVRSSALPLILRLR
jgi:hypothetical protein